jgi:ABC-type ATPase involved in cell division
MIELAGVRLDHPHSGEPLIRRAELAVAAGEVVVITGAAGIGASRLIAALLGEATVAEGSIAVLGKDLARLRRSALRILRRSIGVIPQDLCLLGDRSALVNAILPLEIDGVPRTASLARAAELLARLGLTGDGDRLVEEMAWSSRQRIAVARALIRNPPVIVADQPTSLQDETGAALVCEALAGAAAAGAAVLALGRDPLLQREAARRGWRILTLDDGYLGDRLSDSAWDDVSVDMVIDSLSVPVQVAGVELDLVLGPISAPANAAVVAPPVTATDPSDAAPIAGANAADDDDDSDGIPKGVLPFPISAPATAKPEPPYDEAAVRPSGRSAAAGAG